MASAAVDLLVGKIAVLLENEVYLLAGVRDEVQDIRAELLSMKAFLEDADSKQPNIKVEKDWVGNARDVTYEIEDVIDEFMYHMNQQRTGNRLSRFLYGVVSMPKNLWVRHKIATQLQKIKKTIKEIPERRQRYHVDQSDGAISSAVFNWKQFQGESCLFVEENDLVGIEKDREYLMGLLMGGCPDQAVISVLGMGGAGKTTIVAKTCKNDAVTRYFNSYYAFITVSQTYALDNIFRSLIKAFHKSRKEQVPADLEAIPLKDLVEKMVNYLSNKRYLVVLDDVWDIKLWNQLKVAFPHSPGSRIVITTRKEVIAGHGFGVESYVHRVQPLEPVEAWRLFCMKAFYGRPDNLCPQELKPLARVLVEKCEGLPLALVAMGGLMFSKKHVTDWSKICNSMNWHLANNTTLDSVRSILLLSFNDLPCNLKHCFLFCSIFPEDFLIRRKRLIRLWIGEGFIESKGISPEEVADKYLMELTFRSMLQVVERNSFGRPKTCKMHDLMREIAITTSKNERFCAFSERAEEIDCGSARRLSVQLQKVDRPVEIKSSSDLSKLRSLLVFYPVQFEISLLKTIPPELKLLKVLDLEDVPIENLQDKVVKKLFNLRYLNIRGTLIKELPNSIGRLQNLHTLDIRDSEIEVLPGQVGKLQNLRHQIMSRDNEDETDDGFRYLFGVKAPANISKLKKLEVLYWVDAEGDMIRQLGNMTQLTRIGVTNVKKEDGKDLCDSIQKMKALHHLSAMASDEEEVLDIHYLKLPPPLLTTVLLVGKLERVPPWFCSLQSLLDLYLHWTRLNQDLLPHIAALPLLSRLTLINAYNGQKLYFQEGFAKLVQLNLHNFPELIEIEIESGVMSDISNISLKNMMNLKRVPQGIEFLLKLESLELESVSMELIRRIKGKGSEDRSKVERIPDVTHYYHSSSGEYYYESLSSP